MKLKVSKWIAVILLPIAMTIVACSPKNNSIDKFIKGTTDGSSNVNNYYNDDLSEEKLHLQTKSLKQNNIVYFDLDKYNIRNNFLLMLDTHANFLCNNPSYKVTIEGHTDERGTPEYNISLGERRANAIKMYLQGKGVSINQISTISYGKEKPALLGHDEISYAKNRRAIIVY